MVNVNNNIWQAYNYLSDVQTLLYFNNGLHQDNSKAYEYLNDAKSQLHDIIISMPVIPEEDEEHGDETHF